MSDNSIQFAIADTLATVLGGEDQSAFRCRLSDFGIHELPADNVIPDDEDPEYLSTDSVEQRSRFHIRHLAAAVDGADQVADARYVRGARLLLNDVTLGGTVRRIKLVGRKWEREKAELQIVACVATYEVEYSTTIKDPSLPGY